eukprot:gene486-614_t
MSTNANNNNIPKLYYFDGRGNGELSRLVLNYLEIKFEDIRIKSDDFILNDEQKNEYSCTYGQIPIYIDDSIKVAESATIARYIARKHNFIGNGIIEQAKADEIVDLLSEFGANILYQSMVMYFT